MIDSLLITLGILQRLPKSEDRDKAIDNLKSAISDARNIKSLIHGL